MVFNETASDLGYGWAALLGLIQGLTEFLPISSSGHLALAEHLGRGAVEDVAFDILLHLATVLVILATFWRDLYGFWQRDRIVLGYLVLGSVPAAFFGILFRGEFEALRAHPLAVSCGLLVSAGMLVALERVHVPVSTLRRLGIQRTLVIGLCQALAIVPGISRSGSTITGGVLCGLERSDAIRFSFLLMVPAVLGAAVIKGLGHPESIAALPVGPAVFGFLIAACSGYAAVRILIRLVEQRRMLYFAAYCAVVGLTGLVYFGLISPVETA